MAWSKSSRIITLLVIDTAFFFLELIVGMFVAHSLALVADAFHMLNDVLSLCVGLWAVQKAQSNTANPKIYTYGFQRAETLGALVNGVFLVALCVTIFLEAIGRFVEPVEVAHPQMILAVGCAGLLSNIVGLFLFHDHSHGHGGHSHGHSHDHGHEEGNSVRDAEEGHAGHDHSHYANTHTHTETETSGSTIAAEDTSSKVVSSNRGRRRTSRSASRSIIDFTGPRDFRTSIVEQAQRMESVESEGSSDTEHAIEEDEHRNDQTEPLLRPATRNGYGSMGKSKSRKTDHGKHQHAQPKKPGTGSGHSHGDLNMRGIFLHVMGDALGNIGVIATALFIWLTDYSWRFYFDPAISLAITIIILCSAIPLCKAASRILLQAVPHGIELDEIEQDISSLPGVRECHDLHVWQLSDTKMVASLHVKVDFDLKGAAGSGQYMALAEDINECLHAYGIHSSTIQPEFHQDYRHYHHHHHHHPAPHPDAARVPGSPVHASSALDQEPGCLLDCVENCANGKGCCPPQTQEDSHHGHDHSH